MTISVGDTLPDAELLRIGENGPETVSMAAKLKGRKVVVFGLPGAFTGVCTTSHMPSFIRTRAAFADKGVDEVICFAVNDPFVTQEWAKVTGADTGDVTVLADAASAFTKAIGMEFTAPPVGFFDRSKRFAMYAEDGVVKVLHIDENPGECTLSAGESLLEAI